MPLITDPMAVFAFCTAVCALVFWTMERPGMQGFFRIVPGIVFIYYLPTFASALGVIPMASPAYDWMRDYLLTFSLFVLMVTTDLPSILKIGPKALIMMLAGTLGVIIGGPIALFIFQAWLPEDAWKGLAALAGSWIGGGGNFAAIKESVGAPDSITGPIIIVDTVVGYTWMGILLFLANFQHRIDRWNRADSSVLDDLNRRLQDFQESRVRPMRLPDAAMILAVGLTGALVCLKSGSWFYEWTNTTLLDSAPNLASIFSPFTWTVIFLSTLGIALSFTPLRRIEDAGASSLGYIALYLFLTSIGAKADFGGLIEAPVLVVAGVVWIAIHVAVLFVAARAIRAPLFLVAVGSQANIGAAASAPIVAAAYYRAMAPVGLLLGVFGYLIGNYAALICAYLLKLVSGN